MDFGVVMQSGWSPRELISCAETAEREGLDFVLITDHYLTPRSNRSVDSWSVLAAIAARTERIRLGTCVTPIPFRPPQQLAKIVATVDHISNGRTILGVGAGWHRPEFDAYSQWCDDRTRVAKTVEGLELIRRLWSESEPFDFTGRFYSAIGAILEPKPIQKPHPPLWFGTLGSRMLREARRLASGWVPPVPGLPMDAYSQVAEALRGSEVRLKFNGTLEQIAANVEAFAKMGFDGGALSTVPPEELPSAIRGLAREVAPSYQ